ncbi:hypothetical protein SDC9_82549 [bioreactor metagenome]|uniref:4-oxalocrotonate tautomerase domain-containing protein n=1 Tax=bioreactor metagenome TaxID=1076179 RepID=A0A644Z4W3_9ZZZZ|nr:hypothetical protein [Candidatus Metalachnospira sp.]
MPQVNVKINYIVSEEQRSIIENGMVDIVVKNLGKRDNWLMVFVEDNAKIYFRGDNKTHTAGIALTVYKEIDDESAQKFITTATELVASNTDIQKDRIEVIIQPVNQWGLGGKYIN